MNTHSPCISTVPGKRALAHSSRQYVSNSPVSLTAAAHSFSPITCYQQIGGNTNHSDRRCPVLPHEEWLQHHRRARVSWMLGCLRAPFVGRCCLRQRPGGPTCVVLRRARAHQILTVTPAKRIKMVAMATQKFVADVATDALQHCKQRQVRPPPHTHNSILPPHASCF